MDPSLLIAGAICIAGFVVIGVFLVAGLFIEYEEDSPNRLISDQILRQTAISILLASVFGALSTKVASLAVGQPTPFGIATSGITGVLLGI